MKMIGCTNHVRNEVRESQGGEEYSTKIKRRKANCTVNILYRNCLLKHIIEGKIEGRIQVMGR
jgi:hypothetical protein